MDENIIIDWNMKCAVDTKNNRRVDRRVGAENEL
jgi:hypothetical protein